MLLVDRLLTESSLAAAIQSGSQPMMHGSMVAGGVVQRCEPDFLPQKRNLEDEMQALKMVECRICHDEDLEFNMEVPCSCSGSLKVTMLALGLIISVLNRDPFSKHKIKFLML